MFLKEWAFKKILDLIIIKIRALILFGKNFKYGL